jgi:hypothetical protein
MKLSSFEMAVMMKFYNIFIYYFLFIWIIESFYNITGRKRKKNLKKGVFFRYFHILEYVSNKYEELMEPLISY